MIVILFGFQVTEPSSCTGNLTHLCSQVIVSGEMSKEDSVQFIKRTVERLQVYIDNADCEKHISIVTIWLWFSERRLAVYIHCQTFSCGKLVKHVDMAQFV